MTGPPKNVSKVAGIFGAAATPVIAVAGTLCVVVLILGGGLLFAYQSFLGEPNASAWSRKARATLEHVLPFPEPLVVIDRQEECGNGRDPICESVDFLIRSTDSPDPPVDELVAALQARGWRFAKDESGKVVRGVRDSAWVEVSRLDDFVRQNEFPSLMVETFLEDNASDGVAFLSVII